MKTMKFPGLSGNYYRLQTPGWSNGGLRKKFREALAVAGGTLGLCAFMFVLYLMVLFTSRVMQPLTG